MTMSVQRLLCILGGLGYLAVEVAPAQDDSASVFGYFEEPSRLLSFEFRQDSTFTLKQFFDFGGWTTPTNGTFSMLGDTIALFFPDSVVQLDFRVLRGWKLLFDRNRVYPYRDPHGGYLNYALRRTNIRWVDSLMLLDKLEQERTAAEEDRRRKQSLQMMEKSRPLKEFERLFTIADIGISSYSGIIDGPPDHWRGVFSPLEKGRYPWQAEVTFSISADTVVVSMTPAYLIAAYDDFISAPVIRGLFDTLPNIRIRIRTEDDKLNQESPMELRQCQTQIASMGYENYPSKDWIQAIVDFNVSEMVEFLHPLKSPFYIMTFDSTIPSQWGSKLWLPIGPTSSYANYWRDSWLLIDKGGTVTTIPKR